MSAPTISDSVQWVASEGFFTWLDTAVAAHPWLARSFLQASQVNASGDGGVLMVPVGHAGSDGCVACNDGDWIVELSTGAIAVLANS